MAFKAATRAGISPIEFWKLTPYQTGLVIGAWVESKKDEYKLAVAGAWYSEAFHRTKKLETLDRILGDKKEQSWQEQLEIVKSIMARGKNVR